MTNSLPMQSDTSRPEILKRLAKPYYIDEKNERKPNNNEYPGHKMNQEIKEKPPFWFPIAPIIIRYIIGSLLTIIGIVFFIWGFVKLKPAAAIGFATKLRDKGAYKLTRNPMYFGVNSSFWGIGLILDNLSVLLAAFIWSVLNYLSVTLWEEKQMYGKFGEEYIEYKKRVPRFIPIKSKRRKKAPAANRRS